MKNYYELNAKRFYDGTIACDMSTQYEFFLKYLNKSNGKILDLGFGSGRDMIYFASLGYKVIGIDPTTAFVDIMKQKGYEVYEGYAESLDYNDEFDGIWACASLLHIKRNDLKEVFNRCAKSIKENGIIYCSFKYGDYEGIYKDRFFTFLNEELINKIVKDTNLEIIDILITNDVRKDRDNERWLNVLLNKKKDKRRF